MVLGKKIKITFLQNILNVQVFHLKKQKKKFKFLSWDISFDCKSTTYLHNYEFSTALCKKRLGKIFAEILFLTNLVRWRNGKLVEWEKSANEIKSLWLNNWKKYVWAAYTALAHIFDHQNLAAQKSQRRFINHDDL